MGEADWWLAGRPVPIPSYYEYVFPLVEEACEEVANWASFHVQEESPFQVVGLKKVSATAYYKATKRRLLRESLPRHLNPWWHPLEGGVLKAAYSCMNSGVRIFKDAEIVEEYLPGPQHECDGVILDGKTFFFNPLRQVWNEDNTRILAYFIETNSGTRWACSRVALDAITALGLDNTPFCIEMRQNKVIEVNTRLGEDPGLPLLLSPGIHPLEQIDKWARSLVTNQSRICEGE